MLDAMSKVALDHLRDRLQDGSGDGIDPWEWYLRVREEQPELLFPYLIEAARGSMAPNYYLLSADPEDDGVAVLEPRERREGDELRLPFVPSTGSQSGALGPVIKRTYSTGKGAGPTAKINETTRKDFEKIAGHDEPWSGYFQHAASVISRPRLRFRDELFTDGANALNMAIREIPERQTCLLGVLDPEGRLPGEIEEYKGYLQHILATEKYSTGKLEPIEDGLCSLSGRRGTVYPNGLAGAGLNLSNLDRLGVFPGLDDGVAWKKFALSAEVADLLYVFSYHVRDRFMARVAGERAMLVPYTTSDADKRLRFARWVEKNYVPQVKTGEPLVREERKLHKLVEEDAITSITILWADFGQKLENVRGMVTDVLPSRLREISEAANEVRKDRAAPFPELDYEDSLEPDVAFNYLGPLLKRPGGKRTEKANAGSRLFDLRRDIAAAAYHGRQAPVVRLWEEVREICEAYLIDALERGTYGMMYEGRNKKGVTYLTMAGWVRHLCRFVYFLRKLGVYPTMEDWRYRPRNERLREFFEDGDGRTGLDKEEKVFAFLLGALFGRLMWEQYRRDVNVGANALPWLKRFTLAGKDLPELFVKVRGKLITYGTEYDPNVRVVIEELGYLGIALGTKMDLTQTETGYFLLLGQSLNRALMPGKESKTGEENV